MIRRLVLIAMVACVALVVWFFAMSALLPGGDHCAASTTPAQSAQRAGAAGNGESPPALNPQLSTTIRRDGCAVRSALLSVPGVIWDVLRPLLLIALAFGLALIPPRWWARSRRRYVRLTVAAFRGEAAEPDAIRSMLESFHQQLLTRWWHRILSGQPSISFEVALLPDAEGDLSGQLSIVCPDYLADAVAGTFSACYRDSRLMRGGALPAMSRVVRLKKHNNLVRALREMDDESHRLMDSLLAQMTGLDSPAMIQFACVPTPAVFDRYRRSRYAAFERSAERGHSLVDARVPGLRSFGLGQELEGGLRVLHRPLFFIDIRVAAPTMGACISIAGTLRGESAAENRLVIRHVMLRTALYLRRIAAGLANPIPGWRRGVFSSVELAGMWHVPSPALKGARMRRLATPRLLGARRGLARSGACADVRRARAGRHASRGQDRWARADRRAEDG